MSSVGVVAIGRNEGERLRRCLESVRAHPTVYVDSASTDGSVALARSLGVEVVELDMSIPFSAARARNEGLARLRSIRPGVAFVQFIDGDCEVVPMWVAQAEETLRHRADVAVVCGRRRERHPEASRYNRLCDLEWDTPIGEALACGGDAMFRVGALEQVGGYDPSVIAGEEPELCVRLRARGWKVLRIHAEMTIHDAAMTRFSQWWKRMTRSGHAYAQGAWMHGAPPERHNVKQVRSIVLWGIAMPLAWVAGMILGVVLRWPWLFAAPSLVVLGYVALTLKIFRYRRGRGDSTDTALLYATHTVVGKLAEAVGVVRFHRNRLLGRQTRLIEYKDAAAPGSSGGSRVGVAS